MLVAENGFSAGLPPLAVIAPPGRVSPLLIGACRSPIPGRLRELPAWKRADRSEVMSKRRSKLGSRALYFWVSVSTVKLPARYTRAMVRWDEHTSELQSHGH